MAVSFEMGVYCNHESMYSSPYLKVIRDVDSRNNKGVKQVGSP